MHRGLQRRGRHVEKQNYLFKLSRLHSSITLLTRSSLPCQELWIATATVPSVLPPSSTERVEPWSSAPTLECARMPRRLLIASPDDEADLSKFPSCTATWWPIRPLPSDWSTGSRTTLTFPAPSEPSLHPSSWRRVRVIVEPLSNPFAEVISYYGRLFGE